MTHDQIDKMNNDELDAAVATEVMGWVENENFRLMPDGEILITECQTFSPSTDADDALMVKEKIDSMPYKFLRIESAIMVQHKCWIAFVKDIGVDTRVVNEETMQLAICRAALHATLEREVG